MNNFSPDFPEQQPRSSTDEIHKLVAEGKLLRILRPDLKEKIQRAVMAGAPAHPYIVQYDGEIYLAFYNIRDPYQRELAYRLVQQMQAGGEINLSQLPAPLRTILEPGLISRNRLSTAFALCAFIGTISGVIGMAISVLVTTVLSTPVSHFAGMDITAVVFVVFCVLGWFTSAMLVWARFKPLTTNTDN